MLSQSFRTAELSGPDMRIFRLASLVVSEVGRVLFCTVKARGSHGPQVGLEPMRSVSSAVAVETRLPVQLCFVMHWRCNDALPKQNLVVQELPSCNLCPSLQVFEENNLDRQCSLKGWSLARLSIVTKQFDPIPRRVLSAVYRCIDTLLDFALAHEDRHRDTRSPQSLTGIWCQVWHVNHTFLIVSFIYLKTNNRKCFLCLKFGEWYVHSNDIRQKILWERVSLSVPSSTDHFYIINILINLWKVTKQFQTEMGRRSLRRVIWPFTVRRNYSIKLK